jgi:putative ABC transport system permease protein
VKTPLPSASSSRRSSTIAGDAAAVAPAILKVVSGIDKSEPIYNVMTLEQRLANSISPRRFNLLLLGTFASTALLLALIGIYGVIAYSVVQRTHEIGVRIALGARRFGVTGMVMRQGMVVALAGIAAGVAASAGLTRLMQTLLYDVEANDAPTFIIVAASLIATALLACSIPALRAARIDPLTALRHE